MKQILTIGLTIFLNVAFSQQKDFEGTITYRVTVISKSDLMSSRALATRLGAGNTKSVDIKHGNYKQVSGNLETYFLTKDQRAYIKFQDLDTLYYIDYADDTNKVTNTEQSTGTNKIAGYDCKLLAMEEGGIKHKYYYAPALYMNPDYDKNNKIGRYDVYTQMTSSLYLRLDDETETYSQSVVANKVQPQAINDSVFQLPNLPQKKFVYVDVVKAPEFPRIGGWTKYIQTNINPEVASKYLKIPKGESSASQQVMVRFLINEFGALTKAEVVNKKEVNSKLADEALRVVTSSPSWKPARFNGGTVIYWMQVPITFEVTAK